MLDREHVDALHSTLVRRLGARMAAAGWHPDPTGIVGTEDGVIGHFRHRINDDFAATAWFAWFGDLPPIRVDTVVGLSYERTSRVWPYLLNGYPHSELRVGVDGLGQARLYVKLWELDDVDRAVDQLVSPVLARALDWAAPLASVETLLTTLRVLGDQGDQDAVLRDIPVVLAAAGMEPSEARRALANGKMTAHMRAGEERLIEDFSVRFETWLAAGAPPDPPRA